MSKIYFKKSNYFILISFLICSNAFTQNEAKIGEVLDKTYQQLAKHQTISCNVTQSSKIYWDTDTTTKGNFPIHIIRDTSDSMLGGYFLIEELERLTDLTNKDISYKPKGMLLYDLEKLFISHQNNYFSILKVSNHGGITHGNFAHFYFLHPELLLNYKDEIATIEEVTYNEKACWLLTIKLKDGPKTRDIKLKFWIDKSTYDIYRFINQFQFNNYDGVQFDEWNFSKITYNNVTKAEFFEKRDHFKFQKMLSDYDRYKPKNLKLIANESPLPSFEGWNFSENRTIHSSEYFGQPMVVCVWAPMMFQNDETFELLNTLQKKYIEKGITVLGLAIPSNPNIDYMREQIREEGFDINSQKNVEYYTSVIESLLATKSMEFPNILIDKSVGQILGAIGYPEFFIINSEGVVKKHFIGFDASYKAEIEAAIQAIK